MAVKLSRIDVAHPVIRHCITEGLLARMPAVDVVHLRAKRLCARELLERAVAIRKLHSGLLLINDRVDLCLAAGADGVHLPSRRVAPSAIKQRFGRRLTIGVSCHSLDELCRAEDEGADYAYISPIFESPSKPGYGPAFGLEGLRAAARAVRIPVIALGGVNAANEALCVEAGAAGVAGISRYLGYSQPSR